MKKYITLSVILFTTIFKIQAQETIDLNEAIEIALRNNTGVSNLEKSLQIQNLTTSTARGIYFQILVYPPAGSGTIHFQKELSDL